MRLKKEDTLQIKKLAKIYFGKDAKVYLFGSRIDDKKKGGDIDLYIETRVKENIIRRKLKMLGKLYELLGEQKIDIIINSFRTSLPIYHIAKNEGILL